MNKVKLSLRSDGTFVLIEAGLPRKGTFSTSGKSANLVVTEKLGRAVRGNERESIIELQMTSSGDLEMNDPGAFIKTPVKLRRETDDPDRP